MKLNVGGDNSPIQKVLSLLDVCLCWAQGY